MDGLVVTLAGLEALQGLEISDPLYAQYTSEATDGMRRMVDAIFAVGKIVSPDVFTFKLRPFFDPKTVGGRTYFASGGAQMPVTMVDLLLWGIGETDKTCLMYWNENFQYLPNSYRSKIETISRGTSIVPSVTSQASKGVHPSLSSNAAASIDALINLVDQIIRFRAPPSMCAVRDRICQCWLVMCTHIWRI
jgi:monodechloroaminopyrrolnitrin synthase